MNLLRKTLEDYCIQFQQILGCSICCDYIEAPLKTQCQHYFCKKCLYELFKCSSNPVACPICKSPVNKRSLRECLQLNDVINVAAKLQSTIEKDCSLEDSNFTDGPASKISSKTISRNLENDSRHVKVKENKNANIKIISNKAKPCTNSEIKRVENDRPGLKTCKKLDLNECSNRKLSDDLFVSPNAKVKKWLNDYHKAPNSACPEVKEVTPVELDELTSKLDDIENAKTSKAILRRTKRFFNANVENDALTKIEEDPYEYKNSQQMPSELQKDKNACNKKASLKVKLLKFPSPTNEFKTTKPKRISKPLNEFVNNDESDDPYALFISPAEKSNDEKSNKKTKKGAVNRRNKKQQKNKLLNKCVENELAELTDSLKIAEQHELIIETETSVQSKELNKKRKLKSSTHSFTESQSDVLLEVTAMILNDATDKLDLKCFVEDKKDECFISGDICCEKTEFISNPKIPEFDKMTNSLIQNKVVFRYLGRLNNSVTDLPKSVGCQTDLLTEVNSISVEIDNEAIHRPPPKNGFADLQVNIFNSCKENEYMDEDFDQHQDVSDALQLPSINSIHKSCISDFKSVDDNSTPSKPPKRMKTRRGLCTNSNELILDETSKLASRSARRSFNFDDDEFLKDEYSTPTLKRNESKISKGSKSGKKTFKRIQMLDDSESEDQVLFTSNTPREEDKHMNEQKIENSKNATILCNTLTNENYDLLDSEPISTSTQKCTNMPKVPAVTDFEDEMNDTASFSSEPEETKERQCRDNEEQFCSLDDVINFNENVDDMLCSSTPVKKNVIKDVKDDILEEEDTFEMDVSPSSSIEDVTTQGFLQLKEQINELKKKKILIEKELEFVDKAKDVKSIPVTHTDPKTKVSPGQLMEKSNLTGNIGTNLQPTGINAASYALANSTNKSKNEVTIIESSFSPPTKLKPTPVKLNMSDKLSTTFNNGIDDKSIKSYSIKTADSPKQLCFTATGANATQLKQVKQLAQVLNGSFNSTFIPKVTTHVIVNVGSNRQCERTLKYLQGIACGCWIVSFNWVIECLKVNRKIAEEDYEAVGDNVAGAHGGPTKARLKPNQLLKNFQVFVIEPFKDLTKDQICSLLENCGASVATSPSQLDSHHHADSAAVHNLVMVDKTPNSTVVQKYNELHLNYGVTTVYRDWLLDSVGSYMVKPLDNYILLPLDISPSPVFTESEQLACLE